MTSASLEPLLASREVVVFCGSGGVGKTTTAAAAGLAAVTELGGKVLVLTIDPARRLADALGLEGIGNVERRVPDEVLRAAGLEPRGQLFAAMLDTKASWDDLVLRHAPNEETAYQILENRLYQNITARFVQSHDYIAMERLYDLHTTGTYDLIVVDTPPTRNAIDFLEAPSRMADFFGGPLLRWLTMPYRLGGRRGARVLNFASRPFYQLADRVLGSQFLQDIAEFFLNFQSMYDGFVVRAHAVERLLHDRRTSFSVVTTLEGAPLREAEFFCRELAARGFPLGAIVLNRVLPEFLTSPEGHTAAAVLCDRAESLAGPLAELGVDALDDPDRTARVLRTIGSTFLDYGVVATRETDLRNELARAPDVVATVPAFADDIHDIAGLARISRALLASP
ncbi:MAG TPA: ArsA-related P-loop ATPase [Acidimicrobiia bacterium]